MKQLSNISTSIWRVIPLLAFVVTWELLVDGEDRRVFFFGQPTEIMDHLWTRLQDGSLLSDFGVTFVETVVGFVAGNLLGTLLGLSLWFSKNVFNIAKPYIIALGSAPVFALAPLLIIWFGTGIMSKIMIAMLSTVFVALYQSYSGASAVDNAHLKLMQSFRATRFQTFRKVVAPSALVWVISAFRMNVGFAILGAFIGEFISSNQGLGHMILVASGLFDISLVLLGVLMLILMALLINGLVSVVEKPLRGAVVRYL